MAAMDAVDADALLEQAGLGPFQARQAALVLLPVLFTAMSNGNYVFAAEAVPYRCMVPECESAESSASVVIPAWWPPAVDTRCSRPLPLPVPSNGSCTLDAMATVDCDHWLYASHDSIVAEFGLACQEWKRVLVGTVHNAGMLLSMPLFGYVADRWGRRAAVLGSALGLSVGALKPLCVGRGPRALGPYLALELAESTLAAAQYTSAFVMMLELLGRRQRVASSAAVGLVVCAGEALLALVAWLLPYWRHMQLLIYCPPLLFVAHFFLLRESLRWSIIAGARDVARATLLEMATLNKRVVSPDALAALEKGAPRPDSAVAEQFSIRLLFSSTTLLSRLALCSSWWFAASFVYYGLLVNAVALPGSRHLNFALTALAGAPGDVAAPFALARFGRRRTLLAGFLVCGSCCIASGILPEGARWAGLALFLLGKTAVTLSFSSVYVYSSELFPTSARSSLVGACSTAARVGSVVAPLTPMLRAWGNSAPALAFGVAALGAATLVLLAPETKGRTLPDTVQQAEQLRRKSADAASVTQESAPDATSSTLQLTDVIDRNKPTDK